MNEVRQVRIDGSPQSIAELAGALRAALDGRVARLGDGRP